MSVVAEQHRLFKSGQQNTRASSAMDQAEHYRALYEEMQVTAVAAQAEATSLQLQLERALSDRKCLTSQCSALKSLVAAKDEKLQVFQQKLATIKAAVTKELDKQRSGDGDLRLSLDCLLRCCHELFMHAITPEEFHLAVKLILSTLTPHIGTTYTSSQEVKFGEEMRLQLASLPQEQRRARLAEIVSRSATGNESLCPADSELGSGGEVGEERGRETKAESCPPEASGVCDTQDRTLKPNSSSSVQEDDESQIASPPAQELPRRGLRKKRFLSTSDDELVMRGTSTEVGVAGNQAPLYPRPLRQLQVWRKRLGLKEGSMFTGSLPDLERPASEEGEAEDEEEYIDPREIASAIVPPKLMSQRLLRRVDTMITQTTPTYLKIISPDNKADGSDKAPPTIPSRPRPFCGELEEREEDNVFSDDGSSVDWDANSLDWDEDCNTYATIPAQQPSRGRRERKVGLSKKLSVSLEERIYERVDDILPNSRVKGIPRKMPLCRRSRVSVSHRKRFSHMNALDGYESLDTPVDGGPPHLLHRKPTLPPPRKSSAPPLRTLSTQDHVDVHHSLSVPLDQSAAPHSPAISSDENNQSDCESTPEHFYTTSSFVTMEMKPDNKRLWRRCTSHSTPSHHQLIKKGEEDGFHKPLQSTKSRTLPASSSTAEKLVEHCGYLTKLDARLRPGKRRWFVLSSTELRYYRNKEASFGRPRKVISLNSWCKLVVVNDVILKLTTSSQIYHLSAATVGETERWVQALLRVLQRPFELPYPSHSPTSPTLDAPSPFSSWAHVTIDGVTRKVWCYLDNGTLSFSPQPDGVPFRHVNMASSSVRKVRDSLLMDSKDSSTCLTSQQLVITEEGQSQPLQLVPCDAKDKEAWFYQLNLASLRGKDEALELTPTEQYLATIYREGGALDHPLWKHPVLNMTDCPLRSSLTSLPSTSLTCKAFRLFQNVQMFMSTPLSRFALECHLSASQYIITTCQRHSQLRDELYCQLLRQLTGDMDEHSRPLQQGWCLLSLVIPMFLPHRPRVSWYLTAVLQRTLASCLPLFAGFAQHCLDTVDRVKETGPRKWRPSSQELKGLLYNFALNPTTLEALLFLPVQLPDGTTQDLEFNACSTVSEMLTQLYTKLGMPSSEESGFSLMSDWPGVEECAFFHLPMASKLGDLLACWWHAMEELCPSESGVRHRFIQLAYRNRLCVRRRRGQETDKEAELLAYQTSHDVVSGRHPVSSHREGIKMAAIMAQLEYGDWKNVGEGEEEEGEGAGRKTDMAREALLKFGPMKLTQMTLEHDQNRYQRELVEQWTACAGMSRVQCAHKFLELARHWPLCGATLFLAQMCSGRSVWLAVHEDGVSLLTPTSMEPREVFRYDQLTAFGEDGDHLLLVTSSQPGVHGNSETEKLLLLMSKAKIHQTTDLMTSYLENRKTN